ncbi:MAG: GNAT family N-acetyltransferase [Candidatus Aenigmatarchaeota archaeon]
MEFYVRRLTAKDLPEIMIEEKEAWVAQGQPDLSADERTVKERLERYPPGNIGLYDKEKNQLAGKCVWQPVREVTESWEANVSKEKMDPKSRDCYVINFDIRPSYRGSGASDALMQAALESMQKVGMKTMWLGGRNVPSNHRFYGRWLEHVNVIDNYWTEDVESEGKGVLYRRDLTKPIERKE